MTYRMSVQHVEFPLSVMKTFQSRGCTFGLAGTTKIKLEVIVHLAKTKETVNSIQVVHLVRL